MDDNKFLGCIGVVVTVLFIFVVTALVNGWALATLWGWFIAPTFDVLRLSIVQAIGVSIVVGFLTAKQQRAKANKDGESLWVPFLESFLYATVYPITAVAVGWIVVQFI